MVVGVVKNWPAAVNTAFFSVAAVTAVHPRTRPLFFVAAGTVAGVLVVTGVRARLHPKKAAAGLGVGVACAAVGAGAGGAWKSAAVLAGAGATAAGLNAFANYCVGCNLYNAYVVHVGQ